MQGRTHIVAWHAQPHRDEATLMPAGSQFRRHRQAAQHSDLVSDALC